MEQDLNKTFKKLNPEASMTTTQELYSYINHLSDSNIAELLEEYGIVPTDVKYYARLGNFSEEELNQIENELGEETFKELFSNSPEKLYQKLVEKEKKDIRGENEWNS